MKQVTEDLLKAVLILQNNNSFLVLKEWLQDSLSALDKETRWKTDAISLHQNQGQAQALEEILAILEEAKTELHSLQQRLNKRTLR